MPFPPQLILITASPFDPAAQTSLAFRNEPGLVTHRSTSADMKDTIAGEPWYPATPGI